MINKSQSLGAKTIFIRYNPDDYKVNNIKQNIIKNKKHKILCRYLDLVFEKDYNELEFLSVSYLK